MILFSMEKKLCPERQKPEDIDLNKRSKHMIVGSQGNKQPSLREVSELIKDPIIW